MSSFDCWMPVVCCNSVCFSSVSETKRDRRQNLLFLWESSQAEGMEDDSIVYKFDSCIVAYFREEGYVKNIMYLTAHISALAKPHGPYRILVLGVSRCPVVGSPL
jgi:hypothetical protein